MTLRLGSLTRLVLVLLALAGLVIDAWVHFDLASNYAPVRTSTLSEADLFRAEATAAIVAAVALVARPRRYTAGFAALVTGSGLLALLLYRYDNVGALGPFPNMYEPVWFTEKSVAAIGEAVAFAAAIALTIAGPLTWSRRTNRTNGD